MITRTIQLYVTQLREKRPDGSFAIAPDQSALWDTLTRMPYAPVPKGRIRPAGPDVGEAVRISASKGRLGGWFYRTKFSDFPLVADAQDHESPLNLPAGKGLRYVTHFRWWDLPKLGIKGAPARHEGLLAAEFNVEAPRISSLQTYVQDVFGSRWQLVVDPLIRPDFFEQLKREPFVKMVRVRVPRDSAAESNEGIDALDISDAIDGVEELQLAPSSTSKKLLLDCANSSSRNQMRAFQ
jgi:hypothetical protein